MPLADMAAQVDAYGQSYTLKRRAAPSFSSGVATPGSVSTLSVTAMVHPLDGKEVQRLPEGWRADEVLACFTTFALRGFGESGGLPPDVLVVGGEDYQVQSVEDWMALGGFYRALIRKVDPS